MKLDLNEVATHLGKRIRYEMDEPPIVDEEGGLKCVAPIKGEVTFSNTGRHIVARGSFATSIELECARCLETFQVKVASPLEEEMELSVPLVELEGDEDEEPPVKELEGIFADNVLDVTELLRQDILLAVPIKPICSDTCKGLCAHCGKNLNQGPCECPQGEIDSALAKLGSLLEEQEK
jgi:uncharacterized protein